MANGTTNLAMPRTETPPGVSGMLMILAAIGGAALFALLGFWGIVILLVVLGATTGMYIESVPGYHAMILLNHITSNQRTIFQGMHLKLPWESAQQQIDLRVDLKEVLEETYASADALMETKYVYTIRPDVSRSNAGEKVILYATYETSAIKQEGRALFSMLLSDYYRKTASELLGSKNDINEAVFKKEPGAGLIDKFERDHGVRVSVRLEDSDFDERTQKFRDMVAGAKSFEEAVKKLMGTDGTAMSRDEAIKIAKLMNLDGVSEINFNVHAPDLKNLEHVSIWGGGMGGDSGKKGGKK